MARHYYTSGILPSYKLRQSRFHMLNRSGYIKRFIICQGFGNLDLKLTDI